MLSIYDLWRWIADLSSLNEVWQWSLFSAKPKQRMSIRNCFHRYLFLLWVFVLIPEDITRTIVSISGLTCFISPFLFIGPVLNYLVFQSVDLERKWWRLFQNRIMRTKLDIYVFIYYSSFLYDAIINKSIVC